MVLFSVFLTFSHVLQSRFSFAVFLNKFLLLIFYVIVLLLLTIFRLICFSFTLKREMIESFARFDYWRVKCMHERIILY
jgi:hypothetical protein